MGNPEKTNHKAKNSNHLNISRLGLRGCKSVRSGRSLMRITLAILFAAGFCLAAVQNAPAAPTQLGSTVAVNGTTAHGNVLPFTISSGSDRILIVTVDDEEPSHVDSVMLTSHELLTNPGFESGTTGWTNGGGGTLNTNTTDPRSGSNVAYWNSSNAAYYVYQNVDLAGYAAAIDAGSAVINATGWFKPRECTAYEDRYYMQVRFYDGSNAEISANRYDTGTIINECGWIQRGLSGYTIPVGTRSVQIRFNVWEPSYDAGSADDFSVKVGINGSVVSESFQEVGGYAELDGYGNATSMWVILDADLPADDTYDIVVSGGDKPSVAAMLWSGLRQEVPAGSAIAGTGQVGGYTITTSVVASEPDSLVVGTSGHGANDGWAAPPSGWTRQWYVVPGIDSNAAHHAGATRIPAAAGPISLTETCGGTGTFNRASQFVAAFAPTLSGPPGCPDCGYRRSITIPAASLSGSCGGDVANFPVLISITDVNLKRAAGRVQSDYGYDIAFTDSSGNNALYHDLELYDGGAGTVVAWVKVPTLAQAAGTETVIYMYYGDSSVSTPTAMPEGVWSSGHRGVWHMKESPGGSADIKDSSSNNNHGTSYNMAGHRTPGKIGYALDFDGNSDYILVPDAASLDITAEITLEAWVNLANAGNDQKIVGKTDLPQYGYLMAARGGVYPEIWNSSRTHYGFAWGTIGSNQWQHLAVTWRTNGDLIGYINGTEIHRESGGSLPLGTNNDNLVIGGAPWIVTDLPVDGIIDEVRISSVVRDACWLGTEYRNQNNPAGFYQLGDEESMGNYTITAGVEAASAAYGTIDPAGQVSVVGHTDKSFTIKPDFGYRIKEVFVDGDSKDLGSLIDVIDGKAYPFYDVSSNHAIFVTFEMVPGDFNWSEGDFDYRKQISVSSSMLPNSSCSSSLQNFPVLIKIDNDDELKAHASAAGHDIVFKLGDGTPLNFEVEKYDSSTGSLVAWVRIPTLSNNTDTNLYMYYGNATITSAQGNAAWVWDFANFEGVWHLNESPGDDVADGHADSTSNANHGTAYRFDDGDGGTTAASGLMAGADQFAAGGRDRVGIPDAPEIDPPADMTMEAWIKFNSFKGSGNEGIFYKDNWGTAPYFSYKLTVLGDRTPQTSWANSAGSIFTAAGSSGSFNSGTWYYMVGVHDGTSLRLYLNGSLAGSGTTSGSKLDAPGPLNIGSFWSDGDESPNAVIDEARISGVVRSPCWIQTSYNNMINPGAYITVGGEEGEGATYTITSSAGEGGSISPMGSVTVAHGANKTYTVSTALGYQVDAVQVDNAPATLTGNQYTFENVITGPHSIVVNFVPSAGDYTWDGSGTFLYRRPLVIDGTRLGDSCSSDLTYFPVLVQIDDDDKLKSVSVTGHVQSDNGDDIVFKGADGVLLPHELTYYDKLTGALTAWVKVPALTKDENRTIFMYYGNSSIDAPTENPAQVWDSYAAVWHLSDFADSTGNGNNGTNSATIETNGKIAKARNFDVNSDYISVGTSATLQPANLTYSFWVRRTATWSYTSWANDKQRHLGWFKGSAWNGNGWYVDSYDIDNANKPLNLVVDGNNLFEVPNIDPNTFYPLNTWTYIAVTFNSTTNAGQAYKNAVSQTFNASGIPDAITATADTKYLSARAGENRGLIGDMDEVRISNSVRTACWIETEYSNQNDPAAFISLGAEETEGNTYTIAATAGDNGSISPPGDVTVAEGASKNFYLVAAEGFQVDTIAINGADPIAYSGTQYLFANVTGNRSIHVTFKAVVIETPIEDDVVPPGCSVNYSIDYSQNGFDAATLDILNAEVDDTTHHIELNTGNQAIDPNNIVIPFRQQVAVYFLYEGAGFKRNDFGWVLASEGVGGTKHEIYQDVNDNNNNGVLDLSKDSTTNRYGDVNGDGVVNALDNRQVIGTFDAGTELVFYLKVDDDKYEAMDYETEDKQVYFYTKTAWNQDVYRGACFGTDPLIKTYYLGRPNDSEGICEMESNWMAADSLTRVSDIFGLDFGLDDTASLSIPLMQRFAHVMVGAPADKPNAWVLGWEDLVGAGDTDHNDMVFIIERETGGTVQLKPEDAIIPSDADGNINGVTIGVWDYMPCPDKNDIIYYLSIDAGEHWVEVSGWDEVWDFTMSGNRKFLGNEITNWTPGTPPYTYRTRRVDFAELGLGGKELIWKAELKSQSEECAPKIIDMSLDLTMSVHGDMSRSTPTVLANVLYSGSMETPALDWTSAALRGHLKNTLIYDPTDPGHTFNAPGYDECDVLGPGWPECPVLWDAGDYLKNNMEPSQRTIYIPNVTVSVVDTGSAEQLAVGDGVKTVFSGRLAHYPLLATTVEITDTRETFADQHTDELDGNQGGSGWINRFSGEYRITFIAAPNPNQPITATYSYFTYNAGSMTEFIPINVSNTQLGVDDTYVIPGGYIYDFNGMGLITEADGEWLVDWVRGYKDGSAKTVEKEWVLGAIDHSTAAVATPPAPGPWYYGTAFPYNDPASTNDRAGYDAFALAHKNRRTVVYVGARDGMLHAFDAGAFRWGDNPCSDIIENRGYFKWKDSTNTSDCTQNDTSSNTSTYCSSDCKPADYGTGEELWAFIPANLLPRLKNNYLKGEDQAYVDASPALADVYVNGAWRNVLLAAEGNGGDTIFCLDVTDPDDPQFMWEFADPELFRSRSSPSVAQIGIMYNNGNPIWVAFFVSGKTYDDTLYPSIYVINIGDGSVVEQIYLDAATRGAGGILSGQPTIVDSDGNGYVDRLYIGSDKGLMYKVNLPDDPDRVKGGINHCILNTDFSDPEFNEVPDKWHYQPIYGSPSVVAGNSVDEYGRMTYDIRIFFGTGDSPYYDEDIDWASTRYFFYSYLDKSAKGACDNSQVELDWFFELPEGHRIYASAFAAAGNIYFGTSTGETEDPCDTTSNAGVGFDPNAGMLFAFSLDNAEDGPLLQKVVGNVLAAPVVEDGHIYVQSASGDVDSFGSGKYNQATRKGGVPEIRINWWREMF